MASFPPDITVRIFTKLPVKSLAQFKCVCKQWNAIISSSEFVKLHITQSTSTGDGQKLVIFARASFFLSVDYDAASEVDDDDDDDAVMELEHPLSKPHGQVNIVGSCNGLICLSRFLDRIIVWNPCTRESREIPKSSFFSEDWFHHFYGFGYDSTIADFKLLRATWSVYGPEETRFTVFTLKSSSWRNIESIPYTITFKIHGTLLNGAFHWIATQGCPQINFVIITFDLAEEKFRELPLPDFCRDQKIRFYNLGAFEGCLRLLYQRVNSHAEVWVMKEYGVKASWTLLFTIPFRRGSESFEYHTPLCFSKRGEVVMMIDGKEFVMYKPGEKSTFTTLGILDDLKWCEAALYVESLVSPDCAGNAQPNID